MARLKAFTATRVTLSKTHDDIDRLLLGRGITASQWTHFAPTGQTPGEVTIVFEWSKDKTKAPLAYRVRVEYLPKPGPRGGNAAPTREQVGRAIYWHVKNLFDAVDWGIVEMEEAFMPYMMLPSGQTAYEQAPVLLTALTSGEIPRLLTQGRGV